MKIEKKNDNLIQEIRVTFYHAMTNNSSQLIAV